MGSFNFNLLETKIPCSLLKNILSPKIAIIRTNNITIQLFCIPLLSPSKNLVDHGSCVPLSSNICINVGITYTNINVTATTDTNPRTIG